MLNCKQNLFHPEKFQKQAHDKSVKLCSYGPDEKIWLNVKYILTKQNWKLESKFFGMFQVLNPMGK